ERLRQTLAFFEAVHHRDERAAQHVVPYRFYRDAERGKGGDAVPQQRAECPAEASELDFQQEIAQIRKSQQPAVPALAARRLAERPARAGESCDDQQADRPPRRSEEVAGGEYQTRACRESRASIVEKRAETRDDEAE